MLVVPAMPAGTPAVTTAISPSWMSPAFCAAETAPSIISSVLWT